MQLQFVSCVHRLAHMLGQQLILFLVLGTLHIARFAVSIGNDAQTPSSSPTRLSSPDTDNVPIIASLMPVPSLESTSILSYSQSNPLRLPPLHLSIFNPSHFPIIIADGILLTICISPLSSSTVNDLFSTEICLQWLHPLISAPPPSPNRPFIPSESLPSGK
jgi:hypothetical protein